MENVENKILEVILFQGGFPQSALSSTEYPPSYFQIIGKNEMFGRLAFVCLLMQERLGKIILGTGKPARLWQCNGAIGHAELEPSAKS